MSVMSFMSDYNEGWNKNRKKVWRPPQILMDNVRLPNFTFLFLCQGR